MSKKLFSILAGFVASLTLCACGTPKADNHSGERFEVTFKNYDASILFYTSVEYGETAVYHGEAPTRPSTDEYRYDFSGWDKPLENITQNTTFIAQYNELPNKFTVTWVMDDNVSREQYHYGETPIFKGDIYKPSTLEYHYQFNRWEPEINPVTEDITYTAIFDENYIEYQVKWLNYDRTVLDVEYYRYGTIASYKLSTPTRPSTAQYSYTFTGWGLGSKVVDGNKEFIAEYSETLNQYTITWANWNGSTLQTETYDYGSTPSYKGSTPTRPISGGYKYSFSGWSPTITTVSKNTTYTATFSSTAIPDINYGTEQEPLTISEVLTEVVKLGLNDKQYSYEYFFVKAVLKTSITGSSSTARFTLTDGNKDMDVSSCILESGKTVSDYKVNDIITLRGYVRKDTNKINGYYFSYNTGGVTGLQAPQIISSKTGAIGIYSREDMLQMNSFPEAEFELKNDIILTGLEWTPIGTVDSPFKGKINGNGHSIIGLNIKQCYGYTGLFGYLSNASITNININQVSLQIPTAQQDSYVGTLCGYASSSTFLNVKVTGSVTTSNHSSDYIGITAGICGYSKQCVFNNVINESEVNGYYIAGGIIGMSEYSTVNNCKNSGNVSSNFDSAGGIIAIIKTELTYDNFSFENLINLGNITSRICSGGIFGKYSDLTGQSFSLSKCCNYGDVLTTSDNGTNIYAGGIAGDLYNIDIIKCYNQGNISSYCAGGLCGHASYAEFKQCYSNGTINGNLYGGGLGGAITISSGIRECVTFGKMTGSLNTNACGNSTVIAADPFSNVYYNCTATDYIGIKTTETYSADFYKNSLFWSETDWVFYNNDFPTLQGLNAN